MEEEEAAESATDKAEKEKEARPKPVIAAAATTFSRRGRNSRKGLRGA